MTETENPGGWETEKWAKRAELGPLRTKTEELEAEIKTLEEEEGWSGS